MLVGNFLILSKKRFCLHFTVCSPGEFYDMPDNPCKTCLCGDDGQPTEKCAEMMCDIPSCPDGKWAQYISETCCGFDCVDVDRPDQG